MVSQVRVVVRSFEALSDRELAAWRTLAARAAEPNPFFEPDFAVPAARASRRRPPSLLVVDDGPGSDWAACLPVRREARFRKLPVPALMTWLHPHAFLGTPLMAPERATAAWRALIAHAASDPLAGFLGLELLGDGGPVAGTLAEVLREDGTRAFLYERVERAALFRREDHDYLNPRLGPKRRRELRRRRRQLEEHLGAPLAVRDGAGDPAAVAAFLELEAAGWKGHGGAALATAGEGGLFEEIAGSFAARGRLQVLSLMAGERIVAMKCNLLAGDAVFCFKIAYDEGLARFSPGVQLELENVGVFDRTPGIDWTDSCAAPENGMINRLWRDRRSVATVLVPGRRAIGAASRLVVREALQARRHLRERP